MSASFFSTPHTSLQTPFWASLAITANLKFAIAQCYPNDDVPIPAFAALPDATAKLLAVKILFVSLIETRNASLAVDDILRFRAIHTLGMIHVELNEYAEAEKVYTSLITEADKTLGAGNKVSMGATSNLGEVYDQLARYENVEKMLRKTLVGVEGLHGKASPQYLGAIRGLFGVLQKEGKGGEAKEWLNEGLRIVGTMEGEFKDEETVEMQTVAGGLKGIEV